MKIYVRKMFPHDITHEVSVRTDIVEDFFAGKKTELLFKGKKSGFNAIVSINNATDPRFGGGFKSLLTNEGGVAVNDILLIYATDNEQYLLEIVKTDDKRYFNLMVLFREKNRHAFLESEKELKLADI